MVVSIMSPTSSRASESKGRMPFCSIVIPNFNGEEILGECLSSIRMNDYPKDRYEVIVVDNASTDGSVDLMEKKFGWVRVLRLDKNYGNDESVNRGIAMAKGEYFVNLDNDTEVDRRWLSELVKVARKEMSIGVCGSKVFNQNIQTFVGQGTMNLFGMPEVRVRDSRQHDCFFVSGCSMLVKREVYERLGFFFDPDFFAYFEDVDLCWRARLAGYRVVFVPTSLVQHKKGVTAAKMNKKRKGSPMTFLHYRNKILSFKKNTRFPLTQILMVPMIANVAVMTAYWLVRTRGNMDKRALTYVFVRVEKNKELAKVTLKRQLGLFFI
jgi:GT2 family glycosyltransferase